MNMAFTIKHRLGFIYLSLAGCCIIIGSGQGQSCGVAPIHSSDAHFIVISDEGSDCSGGNNSEFVKLAKSVVESLNTESTSITFGLQVIPTCQDVEATKLHIMAEISQQTPKVGICQENYEPPNSTLIGIVNPMGIELALPETSTPIPIFNIGEQHSIQTTSHNFVVGNNVVQRAEAIAELAVELNWDYTTVIYRTDPHSKELKELLEDELKKNLICVDEYVEHSGASLWSQILQDVTGNNKPRGVILIGAPENQNLKHSGARTLSWIISTLTRISVEANSGDTVYVMSRYQAEESPSPNADQLVSTLYMGAEAVKNVVKGECGDDITSCSNIQQSMLTKLSSLVVNYQRNVSGFPYQGQLRFIGGQLESSPRQPILSLSGASRANYDSIAGWDQGISTQGDSKYWCTNEGCRKKCSQQIPRKDYIYLPGDFIIIVTMPIHDRFPAYPNLWNCKDFNNGASIRAEAAIFARKRLKELLNVDFGLLILDTCFNTARTQRLLTDVLNGTTVYCNDQGDCLNRTKIVGLVGDYSSHITVAEQQLMMPADLIHVAYGAATWKLDDKILTNTHFLRTHPTNTRATLNLLQLIKTLTLNGKADINSYVLIHTNSEYGQSGATKLEENFAKAKYCLLHKFKLTYNIEETDFYDDIWTTLSTSYKEGTIVVYNGEERAVRSLLNRLKLKKEDWWKQSGSIFIMTEVWEDRPELLEEYGELLRGSLTFKITPEFQVSRYQEHLRTSRPNSNDINPWFTQMYQNERRCKVRGSFTSSYSTVCWDEVYSVEKVQTIEIYALFTIKAMYAFAYGFYDYGNSQCSILEAARCNKVYERSLSTSQLLKEKILNAEIPESDESSDRILKSFNSNYDGIGGYEVFSMQYSGTEIVYNKIYEFKANVNFQISDEIIAQPTSEPKFYIANEKGEDRINEMLTAKVCGIAQCDFTCSIAGTTVETMSDAPSQKSSTTVAIVLGVLLGLMVLVIIGYFVWRRRHKLRHRCQCICMRENRNDLNAGNNNHLDNHRGNHRVNRFDARGNLDENIEVDQRADGAGHEAANIGAHNTGAYNNGAYVNGAHNMDHSTYVVQDHKGQLSSRANEDDSGHDRSSGYTHKQVADSLNANIAEPATLAGPSTLNDKVSQGASTSEAGTSRSALSTNTDGQTKRSNISESVSGGKPTPKPRLSSISVKPTLSTTKPSTQITGRHSSSSTTKQPSVSGTSSAAATQPQSTLKMTNIPPTINEEEAIKK